MLFIDKPKLSVKILYLLRFVLLISVVYLLSLLVSLIVCSRVGRRYLECGDYVV